MNSAPVPRQDPGASGPVLAAFDLHKRYREGRGADALDVSVLRGVNLTVTRGQTLQAEMNVLIAKYNEESKKTPQNQAALQAAAKAVQDKRQAANAEIAQIGAPVELAIAYVEDQISVRMNEAIKAAMTAKKVDLLLNPDAILAREPSVDITDAVVAELNRILPNVSIAVPAGYQPGQLVQQRNQQLMDAARNAQPGAAPAAPTGSAPTTR